MKNMSPIYPAKKIFFLLIYLVLLFLLSSCAPSIPGRQVPEQVAPLMAQRELGENELLNVSIMVFDPGKLPTSEGQRRGLSPEIREAEARFVPVHLKYTMQRSGYWGAVRVVPNNDNGSEVLVKGKIEYSDGESAVLTVEAIDSRNVLWFKKTYAETTRPTDRNATEPEKKDIFQDLFNTIANDLAAYRNKLQPRELDEIRRIAELRYGAEMAPDVFSQYLTTTKYSQVNLVHLPADDDPMLARVRKIKTRDDMLIDAINGYYEAYYRDLWEPYVNWRKFRTEEVTAMRQLEREALAQQVLGVAAIVGAIAISAAADVDTRAATSTLQDVMVAGGAYAIYSGMQKSEESRINKEAIEELGVSFSTEAEPLVVEVEGESVRLTGSAEEQYARWRKLLKELYARETGLINSSPYPEGPIPSSAHP
jgi:hypothetical protein